MGRKIIITILVLGLATAGGIFLTGKKAPPTITDITPTPKVVTAGCKRAGCSSQLCVESSAPDMATTCEYREIYGCYQKATCERQSDGKCGFTQDQTLTDCINGLSQP
jgi:hypothetical protein